jgi:hypothetical protein
MCRLKKSSMERRFSIALIFSVPSFSFRLRALAIARTHDHITTYITDEKLPSLYVLRK